MQMFKVEYEGGFQERVPVTDLQILVANGDSRHQARLAYDKDICQVCLRADHGTQTRLGCIRRGQVPPSVPSAHLLASVVIVFVGPYR